MCSTLILQQDGLLRRQQGLLLPQEQQRLLFFSFNVKNEVRNVCVQYLLFYIFPVYSIVTLGTLLEVYCSISFQCTPLSRWEPCWRFIVLYLSSVLHCHVGNPLGGLLFYIFPVYSIVTLGTLLEVYLRKFHILFGQNLPLWKMRKYLKSVHWKVLVFY